MSDVVENVNKSIKMRKLPIEILCGLGSEAKLTSKLETGRRKSLSPSRVFCKGFCFSRNAGH
jgi:hypothetical protein